MAASEEQEPLSAEQRIESLEAKLGTSKVLLLVIALFLIIIISVSVTAFSIFVVKGNGKENSQQVSEFQTRITQLESQLTAQDARIAELTIGLSKQEAQLANSSNKVIQAALLDQENNFQTFLSSLRAATFDLAHMVPGSRAWLELYSNQIDESIVLSQTRAETLQQLSSSEEKEESFFGDF